MTCGELTYDQLHITPEDLCRQMGYGDAVPDAAVLGEIARVEQELRTRVRARFCFFVAEGRLDAEQGRLAFEGEVFSVGGIIARQLRGAGAFACFVATAGAEFADFQQQVHARGDLLQAYLVDAFGSLAAEHCADRMEERLQGSLDPLGWSRTNRFSPGYCGWHVREQQALFGCFAARGTAAPCGVRVTESSLMLPIKSVSGLLGVGPGLRRLDYSCGLCDYAHCYKRRLPDKKTTR